MDRHCAIKHCESTSPTKDIHMFRFPKDVELCKQWAEACGKQSLFNICLSEEVSLNNSKYRVCSLHFEDHMYAGNTKKRLTKQAIPTLQLHKERTECLVDTNIQKEQIVTEDTTEDPNEESEATCSVFPTGSPPPPVAECTTQTGFILTSNTPRKEKLRSKVKTLKKQISRLQNHLEKQKENQLICKEISDDELKMVVLNRFPQATAIFINQQLDLMKAKSKGQRYSEEFKYFCLKLYFLSPKCYSFLATAFIFPNRRTLSRITQNIKILPGFNDSVFNVLKIKVDALQAIDKNCALCFDEISIKAHLFYNLTSDEIIGFEDIGRSKTFRPALYVLTVMVKGIYNNWKQPLAYFFVKKSCPAEELKVIVHQCIRQLQQINLSTRVTICDMGSSNTKLAKLLNVCPSTPYFLVDEQVIFFMFDPPHLIKALRLSLAKHTFEFQDKKASWTYIEQLYNIDKKLNCRLTPKLTDAHIHPINRLKMKVSLATQVLSSTVANAIGVLVSLGFLSAEAMETQRLVESLDKLFDIFNSSTIQTAKMFNKPFRGEKYQIGFLKEQLEYFQNVKVINKNGADMTSKIRSVYCWRITIEGLIRLWQNLQQEGFKFILTRRLNQDALENFFGIMRRQSGCCINPTPIQFQRAFRKLFALKFLNKGFENCEDDYGRILNEFKDFTHTNIYDNDEQESNMEICSENIIKISDYDYRYHNIEANSIRYMCGYLIKKTLNIHLCSICEEYATAYQHFDETTLFCHFKAYETENDRFFGNLYMPHNNFFFHICILEKLFNENFENFILEKNLSVKCKNLFANTKFQHPCTEFPYSYLIKLYSRVKIYYTLKFINKNFKTIDASGEKTHNKIIIWRHE